MGSSGWKMGSSGMGRREFLRAGSTLATAATAGGWGQIVGIAGDQQIPAGAEPRSSSRKFSLAYLTLYGCPPPEMTYIAGRAGYDFVSLRPIYMGLPGEPNFDLAAKPQLLRETKTALTSTGVRVHDIELARIADGTDPKKWLPQLEVGAELGAKHVISSIWTDDRVFAAESFDRLCDIAKPLGLTINLEFVTFASVKTLRAALDVLKASHRTNCGVLVDMLHFSRSRVPLADLAQVPREWFHFVHLCDGTAAIPTTNEELARQAREERLYPGEGAIDLAAILQRIPNVPYSIEAPHLARVKEMGLTEHAFRCLEAAKKYVAAHPATASA
jgi:sugar phosphate isomerase/epimerase